MLNSQLAIHFVIELLTHAAGDSFRIIEFIITLCNLESIIELTMRNWNSFSYRIHSQT